METMAEGVLEAVYEANATVPPMNMTLAVDASWANTIFHFSPCIFAMVVVLWVSVATYCVEQDESRRPSSFAIPKPLIIIAFTGKTKSGKSTAAQILSQGFPSGVKELAFANPLKQGVKSMYNFSDDQLWGRSKDVMDPRYQTTPRERLQHIASLMRGWNPDHWLERCIEEITTCQRNPNLSVVLISDLRYENEAKAIRALGGKIIHIDRPNRPIVQSPTEDEKKMVEASEQHESEKGIARLSCDHVIVNDKSLTDFSDRLSDVVERIQPGLHNLLFG